jgi:hypothetical protein
MFNTAFSLWQRFFHFAKNACYSNVKSFCAYLDYLVHKDMNNNHTLTVTSPKVSKKKIKPVAVVDNFATVLTYNFSNVHEHL